MLEGYDDGVQLHIDILRDCQMARGGFEQLTAQDRKTRFRKCLSDLKWILGKDFGDEIEAYQRWYDQHRSDWRNYSKDL